MKKITKNNLLKLIDLKKQYIKSNDSEIKEKINNYIENVINKDHRYYSKLSQYNFTNDQLKYLL